MTDTDRDSSIQQLVLKIHSRCNLACDHCYVYEHEDQSWQTRPVLIAEETLDKVAHRLAAYTVDRNLESVSVILHGGEPLLVGPTRLRNICAQLRSVLDPLTTLDLRIHTNGVRLNRPHLEILKEFDVKVGISLDGDRAANDRHRLDHRGRSSYDRVVQAVELLRTEEYRHLYLGLLCTVDVANDPVVVHDALTALDPPRIDYLLPHSTWDNPPPSGPSGSPTPYADWLLKIFDRWLEQGRTVPVRTFDSVLSTLRGGPSLTEAMGLAPSDLAVVETDGTFEQADSLKTAYDGAPATGYDVFQHTFEEFARHPGVRARQLGIQGVSETCRGCPVVQSCGGGLYAHRYSTERGFDNPSVFCADLRAFVDGVAERITERELSPAVRDADELRLAQLRLGRAVLARAHDRLAGDPDADQAWRALVRLDTDDAAAPHLNSVLAHPYLRPSLHRSWDGRAGLARFMTVAAAAAVHAEADVTLAWHQPDRELHLPTLGTVRLARPGRVEVTVTPDGFRVHGADATPGEPPAEWRPLETLPLADGTSFLIDDADPHRDCYPVPVAPPLGSSDLRVFRKRLRTAYELLDEREPGRRDRVDALAVTTVTPLMAGTGVRLGDHGIGALGVAVDFEPEEFVRELSRAGRRARLTALRQVADLSVPGNRAGRLLEEANEQLGTASYWRQEPELRAEALAGAGRALRTLAALPERDLTESGAAFAAQLRTEWQRLHD
ncbi:radical SAM/SPASM protein FxsB, inactivated metallohydrolase extension form [Streptomyces avermitilis]|uniref:radical SAM/SPASM protein FxsBH, inactivated beta-hydroxylase extension form n=1 Tax=Streptomyces avermitilis TaxID=33903 RepID=UPI0033A3BDCC